MPLHVQKAHSTVRGVNGEKWKGTLKIPCSHGAWSSPWLLRGEGYPQGGVSFWSGGFEILVGDRPTRRIESLLLLLLLLLLHVLLNNLLNVVELEISFPSSTCPAPSPTGSTHHSLRFFQFYPQSFLHTHHFRTITPAPPSTHLILFSSLQSVFLWSTNKKSILTPSFQSSPPAIANSLSCSTPNSLQIWSNLAPDLAVSASPSLFRSLLRWLFNCVLGAHRSVSSGLRGLARSGQFVVNLREFW